MFVGNSAVYPDNDVDTYLDKGFNGNANIYSIVSLISGRFGNLPRYEYKVLDKKAAKQYKRLINSNGTSEAAIKKALVLKLKAYDEDIVDGKLSKLMMKPNDYQGQDELLKMVAVQFELFGEAFIWKNRGINENGEPLELHVLPTNYVDVVPDPQDVWGVLGYVFKVSGLDMGLRKEDVIHWKKTNPNFDAVTREHLRGQSPLKAGLKVLQQDLDITDASVAMYQNGGARGVLFNKSFNIDLSPEQQTQLKNVIDRKLNAGAVKGAIATLQGDWGYADFGLSSTDMELLKASNLTTEKLCNLFNVPPEMFVGGQTYENKNQARKDFLTNKIAPMCASFDDELNRSLQKDFKTGTVINTEFDNEPELQEDISKLIEYSTKLFDRGVITGNEFRKLTNYDETTEPMHNTFLITGNYTPLQDLDLANQEALIDSYDADREAGKKS